MARDAGLKQGNWSLFDDMMNIKVELMWNQKSWQKREKEMVFLDDRSWALDGLVTEKTHCPVTQKWWKE